MEIEDYINFNLQQNLCKTITNVTNIYTAKEVLLSNRYESGIVSDE